jgi:hypothetical protein
MYIRGFRSSDGTSQPLRLDQVTNSIQTIDYAHHEIHAGSQQFAIERVTITVAQCVRLLRGKFL